MKDFNDFIFHNGLLDLNSVGGKFTWYNQQLDNPIHIKLDRVLVNVVWGNVFSDSFCSIQSPSCSDHCPVILHPGNATQVFHRFLFKNYWTKIDSYWSILLEVFSRPCSGNPLSHLCHSLRMLKSGIKKEYWASSNSGTRHLAYLHNKQSTLLEQMQLDHCNADTNMAYKNCNSELAKFNSLHASWIIQRAKVKWLKFGEDDLKFLYAKIKSRMGSKKSVINLLSCNPSTSRTDVISSVIQYYQELYNPPHSHSLDVEAFPVGVSVPEHYRMTLCSPVLDEEIKAAVFMGSSNSAPGPDGFNFYFFKTSWHIIGPVVCRAIKSFFTKSYMPNGVKATAIAIIPKHSNAVNISDYRPIALCNVVYKIIAKVITVRLKPVMNFIVKDNQAGFLKSRVSTDNILLASDILYHSGKRGKGNIFCAKLDIKKAFDSVSREFLIARLIQKDFPSHFVSWVKACICDVNFSVLLSGALEGYFPSAAGLRQGCPISPYLFCLVMDVLSNLLEERGFKGIFSNDFSISNLLYADDVLIFGEATLENCNLLVSILNDFATGSGLHVNYDKCAIMFPKHFNNQQAICQALSIHNITSKITYLGIPLSFHRLKIEDYMPLMDSLNKKFSGWKANLLSLAGRLQYMKFTIQNTIAYWIRGAILPKSVHKFFKKTSSRFLFFGEVNSNKKLHMIAWNKVCLPFSKGGLGIYSIPAMQFSYIFSVILRMYNCSSPLSAWLLNKYRSPWNPSITAASNIWKSICHSASMAKHCFKFRISKDAPISLKWDHWYDNCRISDVFSSNILHQIPDIFLNNIYLILDGIFLMISPLV
ncbi:Putative ribonuclease H protein [Dendrobium catenatum]|uniref:Ribonuclease H protein n=1 Tax=Dendrobium catenatum TaxID=906689 RepID=A0A2I0VWD9_9ASPA|nr:Putative ribonuclease H protein [Dendrobium catenatum]